MPESSVRTGYTKEVVDGSTTLPGRDMQDSWIEGRGKQLEGLHSTDSRQLKQVRIFLNKAFLEEIIFPHILII